MKKKMRLWVLKNWTFISNIFLYDFIIGIICFVVGITGFLIIMSVSSVSIEQFLQLFTITINGITVSQAQIINTADAFSNVFQF